MLTVFLNLSEPYKMISNSNSSFEFFKQVIKEFLSIYFKNGQRKKNWSVVSVSDPQLQIGLRASLKLWPNLCSFRWLNFNRNLDNNLTPAGSRIANNDFCFKLKESFKIDLLSDLYFFWDFLSESLSVSLSDELDSESSLINFCSVVFFALCLHSYKSFVCINNRI